jgi:ribosomal protein S27E
VSDRKYRQHGYQDEPRGPRQEHKPPAEKKEYAPRGQTPAGAPKTFNMPGFREVVRCRGCGHELTVALAWSPDGRCARCGADLHTCAQCVSFDTGASFECRQTIPVRISPKDVRNTCTLFEPRTTVERETRSAPAASARSAFDDLFK